MHWRLQIVLAMTAVLMAASAADEPSLSVAQQSPAAARIAAAIERLAHESFPVRERATKELVEEGEEALAAVSRAAGRHADPEVRHRSRWIKGRIAQNIRVSPSTGLETVLIEAGVFQMGSPSRESGRQPDEKQHRVKIKRDFLLGKFEVLQGEYQRVVGVQPGWFSHDGGGQTRVAGMKTAQFPVEQLTWFDAIDFCNRLSKLDDFEPYYEIEEVELKEGSINAATVTILGGNGYRLPTEAEWEFACRSRMDTAYNFGPRSYGLEANFRSRTRVGFGSRTQTYKSRTTQCDSFPASHWGLHDMHGNVAEWCWDVYDRAYYDGSPFVDPAGPSGGIYRVIRGGSWSDSDPKCRSASRGWLIPASKKNSTGFRVARTPK